MLNGHHNLEEDQQLVRQKHTPCAEASKGYTVCRCVEMPRRQRNYIVYRCAEMPRRLQLSIRLQISVIPDDPIGRCQFIYVTQYHRENFVRPVKNSKTKRTPVPECGN